MKSVKIAELKAHLSRYLDYVKNGGRLQVVDRTTPIVEMTAITWTPESSALDPRIQKLIRLGLITPGNPRRLAQHLRRLPLRSSPHVQLSEAILEEREQAR